MFEISNNKIITMTRGDSVSFEMDIKKGNDFDPSFYVLDENDVVYFGVMESSASFETALIRKVFTKDDVTLEGKLVIKLRPIDTVALLPGNYYYQVKLERKPNNCINSEVITLINKTRFILID